MSSLQKSFAQIPYTTRLLFAIAGDSGFTQLKLDTAIAAHPSNVLMYDGTILNTTDADTFLGFINYGRTFSTGDLFRDLGPKLYLQTASRNDYIFSYVQQVQGPASEGVPNNYAVNSLSAGNFWICTWAANIATGGIGVNVVRTG
ncbi:MAG: hypothetical protein EBY22_14290 [Gammaproteobacteria bacterium]|nr:hypothetical protein [Gammaproteobacteria bacterium]